MIDTIDKASAEELHAVREWPDVRAFLREAFVQLGGELSLGPDGYRWAYQPCSPSVALPGGIPQLPGALPHETFNDDREWEGALKLIAYYRKRTSKRPAVQPSLSEPWREAINAFHHARGEERDYEWRVLDPAHKAQEAGGPTVSNEIEAEFERLHALRNEAEHKVIMTPAPSAWALVWKFEYARNRWGEDGWPESWTDAIIADLHCVAERSA